jgi:hypothetical protein
MKAVRWVAGALALACSQSGSPAAPPLAAPDAAAPNLPAFAQQARAIAAGYQAWGRVDDEVRFAPTLCRLPLPARARMSTSDDPATHGRKLYSVFARARDSYPAGPHVDQAVVKESWTAEPSTVAYAPETHMQGDGGDHFYPYARTKQGQVFHAGQRAGLYIMFRLPPETSNTDNGWVYATLTAAGEVTAAGRVQACMDCHQHADHERLFGLPD